jgi:tetratricopeptide (TPR) repeat protein
MGFPNEARLLIDWSGNSKFTYHEFLQAKEFERSYRYAVDDQTKSLIASNEELAARGISAMSQLSDSVSSGFTVLSQDIQTLGDSLNSSLAWGFSGVLLGLSEINKGIAELIAIAKSPTTTWAYEQFELARDEARRELFPEALQSVRHAIDGHGDHLGVRSDFRFHFLHGVIRSGGYDNTEPAVVDMGEAEAAFVLAARYSKHDHERECGLALLGAAKSVYRQSNNEKAIQYCAQSVTVSPRDGEAHFFLARLHCATGRLDDAGKEVFAALRLQPDLVAVAGAPEFLQDEKRHAVLQAAVERARQAFKADQATEMQTFDSRLKSLKETAYYGLRATDVVSDGVRELERIREDAAAAALSETLLGYFDSAQRVKKAAPLFAASDSKYRTRFSAMRRGEIDRLRANCEAESRQSQASVERGIGLSQTITFSIIALLGIAAVWAATSESYHSGGLFGGAFMFFISGILTGGICIGVALAAKAILFGGAALARSTQKTTALEARKRYEAQIAELERQVREVAAS